MEIINGIGPLNIRRKRSDPGALFGGVSSTTYFAAMDANGLFGGVSSTTYFAAMDANGNVVGLASANDGSVAARYEYGPFGEVIRASEPLAKTNPFRFSTKFQDDETDLVYYGYRFYNASTGRWISRDPIQENGGLNLFRFSRNDGVNSGDRDGRVLVAVDGTSSATATSYDAAARRWNSHVHNFYEDYAAPGTKVFFDGPRLDGNGVAKAVELGYRWICETLASNPNEPVNLVGHSRGGLAVNMIAWKLYGEGCGCSKSPVKVNFMGLYDAVSVYADELSGDAVGIPQRVAPNVMVVAHARRDPGTGSRWWWGNTSWERPPNMFYGDNIYVEAYFFGNHSALGGDPEHGDVLGRIDPLDNEIASIEADLFVRDWAVASGIRFAR